MILVAARLRDDVDDAAVVVAVLGVEVVRQDAELGNRVEVRHDRRAAIHVLLHAPAVDHKAVRALALPVDRHVTRVQLARRLDRAGDARHDDRVRFHRADGCDARLDGKQVSITAAVERERRHVLGGDDLAELRRHLLDVHFRQRAVHRDRFTLFPDLELDVDAQLFVGVDRDIRAFLGLEAREFDREVVMGDGQARKGVEALQVAHRGEDRSLRRVGQRDGGAWDDSPGAVCDQAGNRTVAGGGRRARGEHGQIRDGENCSNDLGCGQQPFLRSAAPLLRRM